MAGLGKTKPGYASKGGEAKRAPKQPTPASTRHEHEGRTPQPGVPAGPRDTQYPSSRGYRYSPAETAQGKQERRYEKAVKNTPTIKAKVKNTGGFDPLNAVETALGLNKSSTLTPGGNTARKFAEAEGKKLLDTAKENIENERKGLPSTPTSQKNIEGLAAITSVVPAGEIGRAVGAGEKALQKAATQASNAETAAKAASKVVAKVKAAPKNIAKDVKSYPGRKVRSVKSAPRRAKETVARAPELKTKAGQKAASKAAAKSAAKHPVRTGYAGAVALPEGVVPGDVTKRARAAAEGTVSAILHHPGETAKTTLRSLPAAITAPAALLEATGESIIHGTPKPLEETAKEQAQGLAQIASNTFSGDPKKAEEAARKEGSLAFLTPLPAVTRTRAYEGLRGDVRQGAAAVRAKVASKGESANRSVRHAPKNVEQPVFAAAGRREARKKTALIKQRADNPHNVARAHHEKKITDAMAKAPKGSEVALQTLAEYGVRDAKGAALLRAKGPGDAQLIKALDYVDSHPELWKSKAFQKALDAVEGASNTAPAALVGKGERARLLQQGDLLGHTRPEHMVPAGAKQHTTATTRADAWKELAQADAQLTALKRRGRQRLDQAKVLKGAEHNAAMTEGKSLYAQARALKAKNKKLYDSLKEYTRPDQAIDGSVRKPYNGQMLNEYKQKVEASRKEAGLAPAIWTHHAEPAGHGSGMENRFPTNAGRVEHVREGGLAKANNLDRSLEGLIRGTVHMPRMRAAGKQFGRDFVQAFKTPFTIDGKEKVVGQGSKDWASITGLKTKDNPNGGQYDPQSWARFPLREWKNAVKDPFSEDSKLVAILDDAEAGKVKGSEPWVLMPREAIREARAQISPDHNVITQTANKFSRVASRALLGTNPAWAIAQIPAEGIPLLMAKPSLLNPLKTASLEKDIQRFKKTNPEEALALQATAGASPLNAAVNRTPLDMQETYTPALWEKGAKALTRGKAARSALSFAKLKALGVFDVKRQNEYRTLLAAAEADKRFRSWHASLTGLFDKQAKLSQDFRGKSRAELWTWLTTDPKGKVELKSITDYVDNIQGNWSAFTRYERSLAPLAIFYPFLRYSLRWTLWTFPRTHPITATLAYTLGQANANQLEKLVGGPLSNPIAYAFPEYTNAQGEKAVLPGGSRISPGQSNLTQAIATGNPAQILSSANPFIGAGITALTGVEPFTGEKAKEQGLAALNQLITLPAPVRLAGIKLGPGQSTASKAFEQYDPNKTLRSLAWPGLPQSGKDFASTEKLGEAFNQKYSDSVPSIWDNPKIGEALYGKDGSGKVDWPLLNELLKQHQTSEKGSEVVKGAEEKFYPPSPAGGFTDEQKEALEKLQGGFFIPAEPSKKKKEGQYGSGGGQYSSGPGQYSKGTGQYSSSAGQYGGG